MLRGTLATLQSALRVAKRKLPWPQYFITAQSKCFADADLQVVSALAPTVPLQWSSEGTLALAAGLTPREVRQCCAIPGKASRLSNF